MCACLRSEVCVKGAAEIQQTLSVTRKFLFGKTRVRTHTYAFSGRSRQLQAGLNLASAFTAVCVEPVTFSSQSSSVRRDKPRIPLGVLWRLEVMCIQFLEQLAAVVGGYCPPGRKLPVGRTLWSEVCVSRGQSRGSRAVFSTSQRRAVTGAAHPSALPSVRARARSSGYGLALHAAGDLDVHI